MENLNKQRRNVISLSELEYVGYEQAFRALWRRGGKRKESLQLRFWNLNSTSHFPVAPRRLNCQISANQREAETSANVNKH